MSYNKSPKVYQTNVLAGTIETCAILSDYDAPATYCEIVNYSAQDLSVQLNDDSNAVMTLASGTNYVFRNHDFFITSVDLDNSANSGDAYCEVIVSV